MKIKKKLAKASSPVKIRSFKYYLLSFYTYSKYILIIALFIIVSTSKISGLYDYSFEIISDEFAERGMQLDSVVILGRQNIEEKEIVDALNADVGSPILDIDLQKVKSKIEKNSWVKSVVIQRKLPNEIHITLVEKRPLAIWQNKGSLNVIDQDGDIIPDVKTTDFDNLLHVIGEDANIYVYDLLDRINKKIELKNIIQNATRFGGRRWDLGLSEQITVQMPQYDFDNALNYLDKLFRDKKIFNENIKNIDLRDSEKVYIEKK